MDDFGVILGPEYVKKRLVFSKISHFIQKKFHLMVVSGYIFDNCNASIESSIPYDKFKEMFTSYRYFWANLQARYKLTDYWLKTSPHGVNWYINRLLVKGLQTFV